MKLSKVFLVAGLLSSLMTSAFASDYYVSSAEFLSENGARLLRAQYSTGGCNPDANKPVIKLDHVSTKDVTPAWALESNPDTIREYEVTMQAKIVETGDGGMCAMAYQLTAEGNLDELFKEMAPSLGIDLAAKKAHYRVSVLAPQVRGGTRFSAFE